MAAADRLVNRRGRDQSFEVEATTAGFATHLARYAQGLNAAEINTSFYRPHRPATYARWAATVPPGTLRDLVAPIVCDNLRGGGLVPGRDIFLAHAPERVLPGAVLREVVENERIVGGLTDACTARCAEFYEAFARGQVHRCSAEVAELTKLAENAFRDTNVAFANELANVCAHLGLDVWEVIRLANRHPRVQILRPGPGVGGHCIAVDPWFLVDSAPAEARLIRTAREVNDGKPGYVINRVKALADRFAEAFAERMHERLGQLVDDRRAGSGDDQLVRPLFGNRISASTPS